MCYLIPIVYSFGMKPLNRSQKIVSILDIIDIIFKKVNSWNLMFSSFCKIFMDPVL